GKGGDGAAYDVAVRIALGHHAPRRLGADENRLRTQATCLIAADPELADGAELRGREELVLICGKAEENMVARVVQRNSMRFQGAEIRHGAGQRESKLVSLRVPGRMDPAS